LPTFRISDQRSLQPAEIIRHIAELAQQAPNLRLTTAPGDLEFYGRDWTRRWTPAPLAIAFPATIEDVQVIAPDRFMDFAVAENIIAGNAMRVRRMNAGEHR